MDSGGCYCGAVRYELDTTNGVVANCHCNMCRKTSGAPYVAWILVPADQFRLTGGEPAVLSSSSHGTRKFCQNCGTPISFSTTKRPDQIDITVGSLDDPAGHAPTEDAYVEDKLTWVPQLKT